MAQQWAANRNNDPQNHLRHRSVPSLTTNASGVADSMISASSFMHGEELSQFPRPPSTVPTDGPNSPVVNSPPTTPMNTRNPAAWASPGPASAPGTSPTPLMPRRSPLSPASPVGARPLRAPLPPIPVSRHRPPPGPRSPPATYLPQVPETAYDSQSEEAVMPTQQPSPSALSPYDWHEGSSSIDVDPDEDRLLTTSFITALLASPAPPSSQAHTTDDGFPRTPGYTDLSHGRRTSEPQSCISEMTYPPQSSITRMDTQGPPPTAYHPALPNAKPKHADEQTLTDSMFSDLPEKPNVFGQLEMPGTKPSMDYSTVGSTYSRQPPSEYSSMPLRPAFPSSGNDEAEAPSSGSSTPGRFRKSIGRRPSTHSAKTTRSFVSSLVSRVSHATARSVKPAWRRIKPLPPVPTMHNITLAQEREYRKQEALLPLPELVYRAGALAQMLEKGQHPSSQIGSAFADPDALTGADTHAGSFWHMSPNRHPATPQEEWGTPPTTLDRKQPMSRRKKILIWCIAAFVVLGVIGVVGGVVVATHKHTPVSSCQGDLAGARCTLNATCVCTSTLVGQCNSLAQALVTLTPTLNSLFLVNYTTNDVATAIWEAQGAPSGSNCASQAVLVDVAPGLDSNSSPNRTTWAQTALLWTTVQSQNLTSVSQMRNFVVNANWAQAAGSDGPVADSSGQFSTTASGYTFDFAAQTVTEPATSFLVAGEPSTEQISRVNGDAQSALDRMYSFALASSTQRETALSIYWRTVLQQKAANLPLFMSAVSGSPVLLPFDATYSSGTQTIASFLSNSTSDPFPPPLACFPGLSTDVLGRLNTLETEVFGLPSAMAATKFDEDCYPSRPIYGVLDILRLRLPFSDSRKGVAAQAAVLSRDVNSRVVVYNGELLSALPDASSTPTLTATTTDPRRFGTINNLDHVILHYLKSIPNVDVATALVQFVLSSPAVPPPSSSALATSLDSIPLLEVAVFGSVLPADIASVVSSYSAPNGTLFFGSDQSLAVRDWGIVATGSSVVWTDSALAAEVVRDTDLDDSTFNLVWDPAFTFMHSANPGVTVNVGNITSAFQSIDKTSP